MKLRTAVAFNRTEDIARQNDNPADGPMAQTMHGFMAIKRHARPDEVAELTAYVAGPHGAMITGSMQTIDGGFGA